MVELGAKLYETFDLQLKKHQIIYGTTLLHVAALKGNADALRALLSSSPLHCMTFIYLFFLLFLFLILNY